MSDSCAACGCQIVNNRTQDGMAVRTGAKLYCAECAAMILPPEELERLTKPAAAKAPQVDVVELPEDDILDEEAPQPEPATAKPARAASPAAAGSRVQRGVAVVQKRDSNTGSGKRRPATRTSNASPAAPNPAPPSRRSGTATIARRDGSTSSSRAARDEREPSGRDNGRNRKRNADSMGLYISLGVGALVLVVAGYFVFSSGKPAKVAAKTKPKEELVDNDKTPSDVYAQKGKDFLSKNDRAHAIEMFRKAAGRAEKEGNDPQAQKYNMQIVSIEKASTLK